VAVLTNVGLDHTRLLGTERGVIAREKSGIIKPGATVVTGERSPEILSVIGDSAAEAGAELSCIDRDFGVTDGSVAIGGRHLSLRTSARGYEGLFLPLHGSHQAVNAAIAAEAVARFVPGRTLDDQVLAEGLAGASVPGRLEVARAGTDATPAVVLDVAHNPDGASTLVKGLVETFTFDRIVFVLGILADKDYVGILRELSRLPCSVMATEPRSGRAVGAHDLEVAAEELGLSCEAIDDATKAVDAATGAASAGDLVCVTGSHYLVGEARPYIMRGPGQGRRG
ncbi:MAG: bifunctional folylpolyglutamate synthase/dihydrofolate synthase, partial [Actinomycetota bacterium]